MKKSLSILLLCGLTAILFSACKTSKATAETRRHLRDTQWELKSIQGQVLDETSLNEKPYIVFKSDNSYSGNTGCNLFFGTYFNKKKKLELNLGGSTKMLCADMETERAYLNALKRWNYTFDIVNNELILYVDKEEVLRFTDKGTYSE